jgi:hypothetical protein
MSVVHETVVHETVVHESTIHVVSCWRNEVSNISSSSPVNSCKVHVCSKKLPVVSVPVITSTHPVSLTVASSTEKWVPMVVLENVVRSDKSCWAHVGLIKR